MPWSKFKLTTPDSNLKMNPPLRSADDRAALIEGPLPVELAESGFAVDEVDDDERLLREKPPHW